MCFDGCALARAQYARANFRISPELLIFFGVRSFIADKGVVLVLKSINLNKNDCQIFQAREKPMFLFQVIEYA